MIFNSDLRSYRDLPLRYGEFGACHRNEPSGALHGIMRVRALHAGRRPHLLHARSRSSPRCTAFNRAGARCLHATSASTDVVDQDRAASRQAPRHRRRLGPRRGRRCATRCAACGVEWTELPGEGAFYGPKIEYHLKDSIGRSWQCGTMQVDFQMPGRLGAEYVDRGQHPQGPGHAAPGDRRLARSASSAS